MFGLKKEKPKKKTTKKISSSANKTRKRVSQNKVKSVKKISSTRPKKGVLKVGEKYFDSPKEVVDYYKTEGEKVKKAMKSFKVEQAQGYLGLGKRNLMKVLSQKNKLGTIAHDLEEHKSVLSNKITDLKSQKERGEIHKRHIEKFVNKMRLLETESKKILDTREKLIYREVEMIAEMKKMAKLAQRNLDLTDIATANELAKFEESKEAVLVRAKELLSEEMSKLFADGSLLDRLDEKAVKKIGELNNHLAQIHGAKKETIEKRNVLEISEKETEHTLAQAEIKVKKLEEKYQNLLKI
jgi:hypothetical protein